MPFPYIFTFYSFKGGVGRSMAAANVAYALASRGRNVLLMDMDLEAPGLSTFFHRSKEVTERSPLDALDLLGWADGWVKTHQGEYPDLDAIATEGPNIGAFFLPVPRDKVPKPRLGEAGRLDLILVDTDRDYLTRFGELKLPELPRDRIVRMSRVLWAYFKTRRFPREVPDYYGLAVPPEDPYDYVIIDSRTGLTEIGGLCVGPLADRLVVFTGLNIQNIQGTAWFLDTVGVTQPVEEIDRRYDEADPSPSDASAPPRLGPKPTLLVASPVPAGEMIIKNEQMDELESVLHLGVACSLTYHPLLAVRETLFVKDVAEDRHVEYIAAEYLNLADHVMAMVRDHESQLAETSAKAWQDNDQGTAIDTLVRMAPQAPVLADPLLRQSANMIAPATVRDFIAMDRMYRILAGPASRVPWQDETKWSALLLRWARQTDEDELRNLRLAEGIRHTEAAMAMQDAPPAMRAAALVNRAAARSGKGDVDGAMLDYATVIGDPGAAAYERTMAHLNRSELLCRDQHWEEAIADLTAIIDDPNASYQDKILARLRRASTHTQSGGAAAARADLTALVEDTRIPPGPRAAAWHGLAELGCSERDFEGASVAFGRALHLLGEDERLRAGRGLALLRLRRTEEALGDYRVAIPAVGDTEELQSIVAAPLRAAMEEDPGLPGAEAVLEMVERRKQELAAAAKRD